SGQLLLWRRNGCPVAALTAISRAPGPAAEVGANAAAALPVVVHPCCPVLDVVRQRSVGKGRTIKRPVLGNAAEARARQISVNLVRGNVTENDGEGGLPVPLLWAVVRNQPDIVRLSGDAERLIVSCSGANDEVEFVESAMQDENLATSG